MKNLKHLVIAFIALFTISLVSCSKDDDPVISRSTLIYNTNGASEGTTPTAITQERGVTVTLNDGTGFSRSGHTFASWNTNSDGTGTDYAGGSNYTLNGNVSLYAKWSATSSSNNLKITVGTTLFNATLNNNTTVTAFKAMLLLTINMGELGGVEKYYYFPSGTTLPTNAFSPGTIQNGDLMLFGNNCPVLFYTTFSNSYSYTRIGKVDNPAGLAAALGSSNITVKYELD